MIEQEFLKKLTVKTDTKIVLVVMDGLGGLQNESGKTELEAANHPNLDNLAKISICGLSDPISPGITPGSGPAHLSLFGYDPLRHEIGRGLLDTLGIDFEFTVNDMAARGNYCTVDDKDIITDRRAGRISTDKNIELCKKLDGMEIDGIKIFVRPVKEHRFSVIFRGKDLSDKLLDSDPQKEGLKPPDVVVIDKSAVRSAEIVNKFIRKTKEILKNDHPANMVLLRGFSKMVNLPKFQEVYKLTPACIALYPMYKGLARLCGMEVVKAGDTIETEFSTLKENFSKYDFFYMHIKQTDSSGEDGDFARKVKVIEQVDKSIPVLTSLNPDVIIVTGDHSTPAVNSGHSWHPVPLLIYSKKCRFDKVERFAEMDCISGGLGRISARDVMPLALANAGKLLKYGA
ncbi:MAG: 2,3-bisphosphoglycerate-independent phosphoglycerate mutase [Elusimicrobia bacterium]|nr:2,3-bisphosphoglycerate-independent phosphoglycerate mutase [Elusimicrobiota bacterium]